MLAFAVRHTVAARSAPAARRGRLRARPVAEVQVVVQPGDTVWSIAAALAEGDDVRPVVDAIVEANGGADLVAGQRLELRLP